MRWAHMVLVLVASLISVGTVQARTWTVEKDGSGDFTVIQDAVEAAANGDTVLVGPGRFDDYDTYTTMYGDWVCFVHVAGTDLTIIGAGVGETFIGPESQIFPITVHETGIACTEGGGDIRIQDLTLDHLHYGVSVDYRRPNLKRVQFLDNSFGDGVRINGSDEALVSDCRFADLMIGVAVVSGTSGVLVENCDFVETFYGVNNTSGLDMDVQTSRFNGCNVGILYAWGATGSISDCSIIGHQGDDYGVTVGWSSDVEIYDSVIDLQGDRCIEVNGRSRLIGSGLVITAENTAIDLYRSHIELHDSHVISHGGLAVRCDYHLVEDWTIDLTNNWWGVADEDSIAELIKDGNDDPGIHAIVDFIPFAKGAVPNEDMTWSDLKNLYR